LHGFINVNKPQGITSFEVIKKIKQIIPGRFKIGHMGTLDPMASGVLPVAVGKATRVIPYIKNDIKCYLAELTLGVVSDTQDIWGEVRRTGINHFDINHLHSILGKMTGNIMQIPPMYSALHYQGKRLYELARQGITVARKEREILIYSIQLLKVDLDSEFPLIKIKIKCSPGTYVRTLCHDIGEKLGTGGLLSSLIRVRSGNFNIENSYPLEQLWQNKQNISYYILPLDYPISTLPLVKIDSIEAIEAVMNGRMINIANAIPEGLIRLYAPTGHFIALAHSSYSEGKWMVKAERVFK
jgi:tRNA pseudouridine55 synthase